MDDPKVGGENQQNSENKTPSVVPFHQYVGVKEMLKKAEEAHISTQAVLGQTQIQRDELDGRVKALEVELTALKSTAVDPAKYQELQTQHTNLVTGLTELRRQALVQQGVPVDKVKTLNMEQLNIFEDAYKIAGATIQEKTTVVDNSPKPDLGGGGGTPLPTSVHGALAQAFAVGEIKQVNNAKST